MPRKLGRASAHRRADLRAMVTYLLESGRIQTTVTRAKEVAPIAEKMVTLGKKNTLASRRRAFSIYNKEDVVKKLFDEVAQSMLTVTVDTHAYAYRPRRGDAAEMAILEL